MSDLRSMPERVPVIAGAEYLSVRIALMIVYGPTWRGLEIFFPSLIGFDEAAIAAGSMTILV